MEYVKQNMNQVWASAGDVVMPDNGKIQEGWLVEVPPRQYWNWMQNRADTNLAYIFQRGIPEWDANVEYLANKSFVVYNGVTYNCIQTGTNQNPSTETAYWSRAFSTWSAAGEAVGALTPSANTYAYFTGPSSAALGTITSFARSILDDTDAIAVRGTIGAQQKDATLDAIAGLTTAANKLPYFTGVDVASVTDLSAFGRSLIDDADAAAARTTIGAQQADATLTAIADLTTAANKLPYFTGVDTAALTDLTAFGRSLIDDNDAASARTTLGAAPLASPTFTGTPAAPTAPTSTNTTQLATTAFVNAQISASVPAASETVAGKVELATAAETTTGTDNTRAVHPAGLKVELDKKANIASPTFTGNPSAPTQAQFDNDTSLATTAFVQRALGNSSGVRVTSVAIALTAADAGKSILTGGSGTPYSITLPLLSSVAAGTSFSFISSNPAAVTVQRSGTDGILVDDAGYAKTSVAINKGENLKIVAETTGWLAISGSATLAFAGGFGSSLATNGYQKLPSGLIIQWGLFVRNSPAANTFYTFNLPLAFPNTFLNLTASSAVDPPGPLPSANIPTCGIVSTSQGRIGWTAVGGGDIGARWVAIGY